MLRIYGFNLILLPVNLAGVLKSLQQAITGKKIPFARTPKVRNRTATAPLFTIVPVLIIAFSIYSIWRDLHDPAHQDLGNAAFATFNAVLATYAVIAFIGLRAVFVDTWLGLFEHLYVIERTEPRSRRRAPAATIPAPVERPWDEVLYRGAAATATGAHLTDSTGSFRVAAQRSTTGASAGSNSTT